ncbi:uncharacterized protein TRAVEDRAFT_25091 [Trametes versicolor FP-101664 SS1]|uniref:Uncharacterized protein n=1 Tax=Trametes versicolor (strain FP-101664) TaxID=717944 RepID=R7S6C6_TRAVS|nr:uncharacterized protein TRAVEDRAFT_25091 [Trametes versicolor FP-101664 SS1]EIW51406.1 hypothetical protein TRAVEDRAFT_25091 [Trametes versicolor FP-101664 SS1]
MLNKISASQQEASPPPLIPRTSPPRYRPPSPTMSTASLPMSTTTAPTYQIFAQEQYTVFVYDGGRSDRRIRLGQELILHESTLARTLDPFHGRVTRTLKFQEEWVIVEVCGIRNPKHRLGMAVRYRQLGGWIWYGARVVRGLLWTFCSLSPNNFSVPLPAHYQLPFSYELQLRPRPANSTVSSFGSVHWK